MPATSPTLSPTLSAIVAGLRASSSGMPASTLPTKSAPTSAAFVKMPPPTRANNAWLLAPMPKQSIVTVISRNGMSTIQYRTPNHRQMSKSPSPTTVSPITAPLRKATCKPWLSETFAPCAVRELARVAVFIPNQPAKPEKIPPDQNAIGTHPDPASNTNAMNAKKIDATTKNRNTTLYCRFRYARAPSRTCWAISTIRSSPSSWATIHLKNLWANTSAAIEPPKANNQPRTSAVPPPSPTGVPSSAKAVAVTSRVSRNVEKERKGLDTIWRERLGSLILILVSEWWSPIEDTSANRMAACRAELRESAAQQSRESPHARVIEAPSALGRAECSCPTRLFQQPSNRNIRPRAESRKRRRPLRMTTAVSVRRGRGGRRSCVAEEHFVRFAQGHPLRC